MPPSLPGTVTLLPCCLLCPSPDSPTAPAAVTSVRRLCTGAAKPEAGFLIKCESRGNQERLS